MSWCSSNGEASFSHGPGKAVKINLGKKRTAGEGK